MTKEYRFTIEPNSSIWLSLVYPETVDEQVVIFAEMIEIRLVRNDHSSTEPWQDQPANGQLLNVTELHFTLNLPLKRPWPLAV